jgi:hypothetical protein
MSKIDNNEDNCDFYDCEKITYSAPEDTIILSKPNKTLLCTQTILLDKPDWDTPNILNFSGILCFIINTREIPVAYTTTIEKISNEITTGEIDIGDYIYYSHKSYISEEIVIKSIDKQKNNITFSKNDVAIIKIYASSIGEENKIITTPKLLNANYFLK